MERDVVIVGAGVVGAAIARELARLELRVTLLEAGPDVGVGTSKANTALLHTGFDAKPGTLEARLVARGCELLREYAPRVGIPLERPGALLVAWNDAQRSEFSGIVECAKANGYHAMRELDGGELYRREPNLGPGATGALEVPDEGLICPFTTPLAFATEAVLAGCELRTRTALVGVERLAGGGFGLQTTRGLLTTRRLVNAAGLRSDEVDRLLGRRGFTVTARRGELIVFDKLARPLVEHIVLAVPTKVSKGVLVSPTVFGNVMVGPTAEDIERKDDTSSTEAGLAYLREEAGRIVPALLSHEVTAVYVGLRAHRLPDRFRGWLCLRGRHPLDRPVCLDGDRRVCAAWLGARRARAAERIAGAANAQPRRALPAPVLERGADRGGSRLRADRLLLRAGDARRDP
jgi:glycerol-3-phosphate dehydrogenase